MTLLRKAVQAAACTVALAAVSFTGARAEESATPATPAPAKPVARSLNRSLLSIALPAPRTDLRPGSNGVAFEVAHTGDKAWYAKVADGNPRSPAASKGVAVVGSGGDNEVWGYDLEGGKRRWVARSDDSGISSIVISGDSAYFTTYSCTLERVLVATGAHKFRKWISPTVDCAPDVAGEFAYASYRGGANHMISAHSIGGGGEAWKVEAPGSVVSTPVVRGKHLYVTTTDGRLASFDAASGRQAWSRQVGALSAPVLSDYGLLVVTAAVDEAPAAPAAAVGPAPGAQPKAPQASAEKDDRRTESAPKPKAPEQAAPLRAIGRTLAVEGSHRLALMPAQSQPVGGDNVVLTGPAGSGLDYVGVRPGIDGELAVIAMGSRVIALDLTTDTIKWELQVETRHGQFCQPAFGENLVVLADSYGFVTAVERNTGNLVWSYRMEGQSFTGTPSFDSNRVVLTTNRGLLVCLPTGTRQSKREHDAAPVFRKAVLAKGGVTPARDEPVKGRNQPAARSADAAATPIEPPAAAPQSRPGQVEPPVVTEDDPFEGLPEDRRVGPGGIAPPKAGPGGIAPRQEPPPALPNPFEKRR